MSGYKGHLVGGTVAFFVVLLLMGAYCTHLQTAFMWLVFCLAGSLFPDIDVKSKGQKYFYWVVVGLMLLTIVQQRYDLLAIISILSAVPMLVKHRGLFHEPWFLITLPLIVWCAIGAMMPHAADRFFIYALFFIGGALSHLILDRGVRGIFPLRKFRRW